MINAVWEHYSAAREECMGGLRQAGLSEHSRVRRVGRREEESRYPRAQRDGKSGSQE